MKILFVANLLPYPPHDGGRIRWYHLVRALAETHEVWLLAAAPDAGAREEFLRLNPRIRHLPIEYRPEQGRVRVAEAAREVLQRERFDAVHVAQIWQWPGTRALGDVPVVLDADNVDTLLQRRLLGLKGISGPHPDLLAVEALERQAYQRADRILLCSRVDAERVRERAPCASVDVVPNGVELEQFPYRPERPRGRAPIFTYIGMLSYAPNADALDYFVSRIWPLIRAEIPEARFRIVGRCPSAEVMALTERPGVELVPDVPEILPYFHDADALLVPLRAGSGTRLKILEALASGCPVVTTSLGCEGLEVRNDEHLFIADDPAQFARHAVWVARHPDAVRPLQDSARRLVEEEYTWERIGQQLRDVYQRLSSVRR